IVAGAAGGTPGLGTGAVLVVGFDGLPEQIEWQCAELARLAAPHGGRDATPLSSAAWPRLAAAVRDASPVATAVMSFDGVPAQVPVGDGPGAAGRVMQRIKAQLDPKRILNPGRFVAGI